ncbi:DNA-deoxyinosine glycosylase [Altericroceibacterium endophyticum]|uniref:DNA-deoxyinosine glycosylase n=1 Tax=Altericroceibacterium endophyticum TaxID=1808508 RepID=UPI00301CA8D6
MQERKTSFAPVVANDTRVLILGSLPGEASLKAQRYYAHSQNKFWHLVGSVIGRDLAALDYSDRLSELLTHHIGLWDVVESASRKGSLDSAIRDARHNALADLVATLPDLRCVAFNGQKSARIGMRELADFDAELLPLPSSSPAYASMSLTDKEQLWAGLGKFLR